MLVRTRALMEADVSARGVCRGRSACLPAGPTRCVLGSEASAHLLQKPPGWLHPSAGKEPSRCLATSLPCADMHTAPQSLQDSTAVFCNAGWRSTALFMDGKYLRSPSDHVLHIVCMPWAVHVRIVPLVRLVLDCIGQQRRTCQHCADQAPFRSRNFPSSKPRSS